MRETFYLFAYGTLRTDPGGLLEGCERVATGVVRGTLYDLGEYPALILGGDDPVSGVIWRCPYPLLEALDRYEGTEAGLFRRVGIRVGDYPCWVYVAGPELGPRLLPETRVETRVGEESA
ncbi:MAG: gamma-glutamylcyclotransferase family protein [Longimicrobiales bacterium]|nr:gamma-glutamylcyclotransferase family protein [Longimicrobiales bacterium]